MPIFFVILMIFLAACPTNRTPRPAFGPERYLVALLDVGNGLGNRLALLGSAYVMAKITHREFIVYWKPAPKELPAEFNELYENKFHTPSDMKLPPNFRKEEFFDSNEPDDELITRLTGSKNTYKDFTNIPSLKSQIVTVQGWFAFAPDFSVMKYDEFLKDYADFLRSLKPIKVIEDKITALWNSHFSDKDFVVGIHYRSWTTTADSYLSKKNNAAKSLFIKRMEQAITSHPNVKFFMASSDPTVSSEVQKAFPGRVFLPPPSKVGRETLENIQNALLDWSMLSRTSYIIGSNESTFSVTAAMLTKEQRLIPLGPKVFVGNSEVTGAFCFEKDGKLVMRDINCPGFCCKSYYHDYVILRARGNGMFSILDDVWSLLEAYDSGTYAAIKIDFGSTGLYYDKTHGSNWFQYYFEPLELGNPTNDPMIIDFPYRMGGVHPEFPGLPANKVAPLVHKYIKLKRDIQEQVNSFANTNFTGHTIIGIHYRGTDKSSETPRVPYDKLEEAARKEIQKIGSQNFKIFIATDETKFLDHMKSKFGNKIIHLENIERSSTGASLHNDKTSGQYEIGKSAILDCVLLSKTNVLIRTDSNLSRWATYFNPDLPVILLSQRPPGWAP